MEALNADTVAALCGFAGGLVLGFAARWGRFCTLKAIEDAMLGSDLSGLRMWGLAIAVAIAGTHALDHAGLIDISASFYVAAPTSLIGTVIGGLIFGLGMALVGTCGFGTLARMGGGDLKSVVTFLIMGISAYATLRGATAYLRVALFSGPEQRETPASFAASVASSADFSLHSAAYLIAALLLVACLSSRIFRGQHKKLFVGTLVGLAIVWGWFSTGVLAADPFDPHPLESYTFSAPLGETVIYAMTMSGSSLKFGIGAVLGVVSGAAITSLIQGHFRWEACDDAREMRRQILGGFLMGFGGVTALGCTVGQGLTAASVLAWSAPLALGSIFIGAWFGLNYLITGSVLEPVRGIFGLRQTDA